MFERPNLRTSKPKTTHPMDLSDPVPARCFWYFGTGLGKTRRAVEEAGEGAVFVSSGKTTVRGGPGDRLIFDDCEPQDKRIVRVLLPILNNSNHPMCWITSVNPPPEEFKKIPGVSVVEFKE